MKTKQDLIKSIHVNQANFEHIAKTGNINGTLFGELNRILDEHAFDCGVIKMEDDVVVVFKNKEGETVELSTTARFIIENTSEDLYDMLEKTKHCTSSSCNNESQNFCDCGPNFDEYEINEIKHNGKIKNI